MRYNKVMPKRLSDTQERELCRFYETALPNGDMPTAGETAVRFGCSDGTVRNILLRHGIALRKNQGRWVSRLNDPETEQAICAQYWERLPSGFYPSYEEVAQRFGCSPAHVRDLLSRYRVPRRTNAETRERRPCKPINQPTTPAPQCACGCGLPTQWMSKDRYWTKFAKGHYRGQQRRKVQEPESAPWRQAPMKHGWKRLADQIRDRDDWRCQICWRQYVRGSGYLHVHHIDQDRSNSHPHNLISLCAKCHAPAHNNEPVRIRLATLAIRNTA